MGLQKAFSTIISCVNFSAMQLYFLDLLHILNIDLKHTVVVLKAQITFQSAFSDFA